MFIQIHTLQLVDVFESFSNMCLKVNKLNLDHFISAPGLAWQPFLKKTKPKLELLTDIDLLLMVGKTIKDVTCYDSH